MLLITFGSPFKNREDKEGGKIKTIMVIAKLFALHVNAKKKKKKKNKNYKTSYVTN